MDIVRRMNLQEKCETIFQRNAGVSPKRKERKPAAAAAGAAAMADDSEPEEEPSYGSSYRAALRRSRPLPSPSPKVRQAVSRHTFITKKDAKHVFKSRFPQSSKVVFHNYKAYLRSKKRAQSKLIKSGKRGRLRTATITTATLDTEPQVVNEPVILDDDEVKVEPTDDVIHIATPPESPTPEGSLVI